MDEHEEERTGEAECLRPRRLLSCQSHDGCALKEDSLEKALLDAMATID